MSAEQPKDGGAAGRAIIAEFNQRRQRLADTARKLEELVNEVQVRRGEELWGASCNHHHLLCMGTHAQSLLEISSMQAEPLRS
eukprot:1140465-Pelagomonas_calceolata.AAC.5